MEMYAYYNAYLSLSSSIKNKCYQSIYVKVYVTFLILGEMFKNMSAAVYSA